MRVEGRSKIIASVLPSSGRARGGPCARRLHRRRSVEDAAQLAGGRSSRSRKWRTGAPLSSLMPRRLSPASAMRLSAVDARRVEAAHAFGEFFVAEDQRRHDAHDIVAGGDRQQMMVARQRREIGRRHLELQADHEALAAHVLDHVGMSVLQRGQLLTRDRGRAARHSRGSPAPARRRARRCRSPSRADCRRTSCRGRRRVRPLAASAVARHAPTGNPPPRPLAEVRMSGRTPESS